MFKCCRCCDSSRTLGWLIAVIVVLLFASGCSSSVTTKGFPDRPIPNDDGKVPLSVWQDIAPDEDGDFPRQEKEILWLLPDNLYNKTKVFKSADELEITSFGYNGLGLPFLLLPIRASHTQTIYTPDSASPEAKQKVYWSPFWAGASHENWPDDRTKVEACGIPLFFGKIKGTAPTDVDEKADFGFWQVLWSLGPAYLTFDVRDTDIIDDEEVPDQVKGYMGAPLALGGMIGTVLWFDLGVDVEDSDDSVSVGLHGPLFGSLGLINVHVLERDEGDEARIRLLLSGILWTDLAEREDGAKHWTDSRHGPLWGIVGWGRKNGKANVRLLWVPITLPFQGDGDSSD
ncbi:hypothetical protein KQI84_03480 [bacterium]|nr:hypothetical protein [bacterium]